LAFPSPTVVSESCATGIKSQEYAKGHRRRVVDVTLLFIASLGARLLFSTK